MSFDLVTVAFLLAGAGLASFVAGFAGFGTALMASGLYFHALPAAMVPPLIVLGSVIAHLTTLTASRAWVEFRPALPFLVTGALGVPLGVAALSFMTPDTLRGLVGVVLIAYGIASLTGILRPLGAGLRSAARDGAVGGIGGVLGGIAGLSGVLPMVWLQLADAPPREARTILQAFNLAILALSGAVMAVGGLVDRDVLMALALILPASIAGALLGNWAFGKASVATFKRVVLVLLLGSGLSLVARVFL